MKSHFRASVKERKIAFFCIYPEVARLCEKHGIFTLSEIARRIFDMGKNLEKPEREQEIIRLEGNLRSLLSYGKTNPWNILEDRYHPLAVAIANLFKTHPTFIFGSAEKLKKGKKYGHRESIQQRKHIIKLIHKAGLELFQIRKLASVPELKGRNFLRLFDGTSCVESCYASPFSQKTGEPLLWCIDLATILDVPVEDLFKYEAEKLRRYKGYGNLPMHNYLSIEEALNVPDPDRSYETICEDSLENNIARHVALLPPKERYVLCMRYGIGEGTGDGHTLETIASLMGVTREWVRQIELRALKKLRIWERNGGPRKRKSNNLNEEQDVEVKMPNPLSTIDAKAEYDSLLSYRCSGRIAPTLVEVAVGTLRKQGRMERVKGIEPS